MKSSGLFHECHVKPVTRRRVRLDGRRQLTMITCKDEPLRLEDGYPASRFQRLSRFVDECSAKAKMADRIMVGADQRRCDDLGPAKDIVQDALLEPLDIPDD